MMKNLRLLVNTTLVLFLAVGPRWAVSAESTQPAAGHWSFQSPQAHPLPAVRDRSWPKTPVDFFILAKLEEKQLSPAPAADKRTLLRRASFDLTGLPPSSELVEEFLGDETPEAFSRVIEKLLALPAYGERWGRYWLDVARYADTKGYVYSDREEPRFVHSYVYRDWVVRAFNEDMPYDEFLKWQIAGEQMAREVKGADHDRNLAGLGFLTLGRRFLGVAHDIIDDRIDVLMRGTQGLTVSCARCHDHKFDPISIRDYYALYGVFAGSTEGMVRLEGAGQAADFDRGFKERTEKYHKTFQAKRDEFANRFRSKSGEYLVAVLDVKKLPTEEHYEIRGPDDINPTVVRSWENYLAQARDQFDPIFGLWHALEKLGGDKFEEGAKGILAKAREDGRFNGAVLRALEEKPVRSMREVAERYGKLLEKAHEQWERVVHEVPGPEGRPEVLPEPDMEQVRQVLYGPQAPVLVPADLAAADMEWYFDERTRVELMKLHAEIERWIIKTPSAPPHAIILQDRPAQKDPRVFIRGNPATKGESVPRGFLAVLNRPGTPFRKGSGRLELAEAIASADNPLTARVMVNRIWLHHFGSGLVRTPSDFGLRSEPPTHPELLDWLARYFMEQDWSVKSMHRLIMNSSVYQQSSAVEAVPQSDPENRLLSRMNRHRLDFEALRDAMLAVSGELERSIGGPAQELFKAPYGKRRTIYGYIDRQFLPGVFRVFDFANPDMHNPQRPETTVPQQALFFMNSPFVVERARALMERAEFKGELSEEQRIDTLYRVIFQRPPNSLQRELGISFVRAAEAEPPFVPPAPPPSPWRYGYGEYEAASGQVRSFVELTHFSGEAWQGGAQWPDEKLGWVRLTAGGGHAGNDKQHAAIRRWVSPVDGVISISGVVRHEHEAGDGVRARIVAGGRGLLGEWTVHKNKAETNVESVSVRKGDTLDFVVDLNEGLNNDDFAWVPVIQVKGEESSEYGRKWNAKQDFSGPPAVPPRPLNAWEKYAQVLLLSNEFLFVD